MRVMVFFDLPNVFNKDKRNYMLFRKFLIKEGFIMMQESVYSKLVLNTQQSLFLINKIKINAPSKGIIQVLTITERQYAQIKFIAGKIETKIIDNDERLIIL